MRHADGGFVLDVDVRHISSQSGDRESPLGNPHQRPCLTVFVVGVGLGFMVRGAGLDA